MFRKITFALDRAISIIEAVFLTAGLAVMVAALFAEVVCGFFDVSLPWASELALYLMVWVMCFGASAAVRGGNHIAVGLIADRLHGLPARVVRLSVLVFCLLLCIGGVVLGWQYTHVAYLSGKHSVVMRAPMWIVYAAFPVTAGLMSLRVLLLGARGLAMRARADEPERTEQL